MGKEAPRKIECKDCEGFWRVVEDKYAQIYEKEGAFFADFHPSKADDFKLELTKEGVEMNGWSLVLHEGDYDVKKPSALEWRKEGKDNLSWERVEEITKGDIPGEYLTAQGKVVMIDEMGMHMGGKTMPIEHVNAEKVVERYFKCGKTQCRSLRVSRDNNLVWKPESGGPELTLRPRFKKDQRVYAISPSKKLRECRVVEVKGFVLHLHYVGYDSSHDADIELNSGRVSITKPANYKVGDKILQGTFNETSKQETTPSTSGSNQKDQDSAEPEGTRENLNRDFSLNARSSRSQVSSGKTAGGSAKTKDVLPTNSASSIGSKSKSQDVPPTKFMPSNTPDKKVKIQTPVPPLKKVLSTNPAVNLDDSIEHFFETTDAQGGSQEEEEFLIDAFSKWKNRKRTARKSDYDGSREFFMLPWFRSMHMKLHDFQEKTTGFFSNYYNNFHLISSWKPKTEDDAEVGEKRRISGAPDPKRRKK